VTSVVVPSVDVTVADELEEAGMDGTGITEIPSAEDKDEDGCGDEVGVAEVEAAAAVLTHATQTVEVDVKVCVDSVVNTDVRELPPDE
jgi:hypothetical protein